MLNDISTSCTINRAAYHVANKKIPASVTTIYGELLEESITKLFSEIQVKKNDVFYDLGSGTGHVVLQVALEHGIRSTGIEYVTNRCNEAQASLDKLVDSKHRIAKKITFICGDFLKQDLMDATIIYMANTCFTDDLMTKLLKLFKKCPKLRYVLALKEIVDPFLTLEKTMILATSWSAETTTYIYVPTKIQPRTRRSTVR